MLTDLNLLVGTAYGVAPLALAAWWKLRRYGGAEILLDHETEAVAEVWDQAQWQGWTPYEIHREMQIQNQRREAAMQNAPYLSSGPDFNGLALQNLAETYRVDTGQITRALDAASESNAW